MPPEEGGAWVKAYHGTWWYALSSLLTSGVVAESADESSGHEFWAVGAYCSPLVETARQYARPQRVFSDGMYHRVMLEVVHVPGAGLGASFAGSRHRDGGFAKTLQHSASQSAQGKFHPSWMRPSPPPFTLPR